jgi:poly-gamma-glutamate synthesis protein (capsule biosynthesis protein)
MAVNILIAGDCGPAHGPDQGFPIEGYTELILSTLKSADFRLVNCMRTYSTRAVSDPSAPQVGQPIVMADLYTHGGFDGLTMANNHAFDSGPDAMVDTVDLFRKRGIQVTGAGRNLADAATPVILEKDGLRIAYLGCTSLGKQGGEATERAPGVFNVRIHTSYEHRGPHAPVRIRTEPDADGLAQLLDIVRNVRASVDRLIIAFHSGVIRVPRVISDYQVTVAHAFVDAGADLVVCHAPHIPKGIEVYKGKAIFYSLGVFAMTKPFPAPSWSEPAWSHGAVRNHMDLDPDYPFMPYGAASRLALLARASFDKGRETSVSFVPVMFDKRYRPLALQASDPRFKELLDYMEWASVDLAHSFQVEGNEVIVTA